MSALTVFNFQESHPIRIQIINNEPWFCLTDICKVLTVDRSSDLVRSLDAKGVVKNPTLTKGGNQQLNFVNEPNLYRVIFRSNKSEARQFQDWVFNEVLPTIRKTGSYTAPAKPEYNGTPLSREQVIIINNLLHNIRYCFIGTESANQAVQNRLRVDLRLRTMQDLRAQHFEQAKAILEDIHQHAKDYLSWRNHAENQAIEHLIHAGRPWTPTLVGKLKKQLGLTVGNYPDWHKLADTLNAAVKGA